MPTYMTIFKSPE